mgnify:CR=1 FL=1|jgi:archaellum biogenesis protein FlaJ (TadC family)
MIQTPLLVDDLGEELVHLVEQIVQTTLLDLELSRSQCWHRILDSTGSLLLDRTIPVIFLGNRKSWHHSRNR